MLLDLPSGLQVEARRMSAIEAIDMAEKAKSSKASGNAIARLLSSCTEHVVSAGPYPWVDDGATGLDWMGALAGDLIVGLMQLRSGSMRVKDRYVFREECAACEEPYLWSVPLYKLPIRKLSESSADVIRNAAGKFSVTIDRVDGKGKISATFVLPTSKDDEPMRQLFRQLNRRKSTVVEQLAQVIRTVDGGAAMSIKQRHEWVKTLDLDDVNELLAKVRDADCGVDTRIYTRCPECGRSKPCDLPFGESFFNPQEGERLEALGIKMASDEGLNKAEDASETTTPPKTDAAVSRS